MLLYFIGHWKQNVTEDREEVAVCHSHLKYDN